MSEWYHEKMGELEKHFSFYEKVHKDNRHQEWWRNWCIGNNFYSNWEKMTKAADAIGAKYGVTIRRMLVPMNAVMNAAICDPLLDLTYYELMEEIKQFYHAGEMDVNYAYWVRDDPPPNESIGALMKRTDALINQVAELVKILNTKVDK